MTRRTLTIVPLAIAAACSLRGAPSDPRDPPRPTPVFAASQTSRIDSSSEAARESGAALDAGQPISDRAASSEGDAGAPADTSPLHKTTRDDLLALFALKPLTPNESAHILPGAFLNGALGVGSPSKIHQGNPSTALHEISRAKCLAGLAGVTLQTPAQRTACGQDNMVPVHVRGKDPYFCIDVFEFPNKPCELPFVWASPTYAKKICELSGKRLCSQIEWQLACHADPADGPDSRYAYGDTLDLDVCHTKRKHRTVAEKPCTSTDAQTTYRTCSTDTEPSGAFPKCRSRYGVYDLHGNVAEIMMRRDADGSVKSQLKGSAWFYDEVAREVAGPPLHAGAQGAYPDHCNFDPRWHVESIENAWHVNYHLGFRCCKSIP